METDSLTPVVMETQGMPTLSRLAARPRVDIEFREVGFAVGARGGKKILHEVSGQFLSGQLTAIMGSSGAGKSTLMDILTGNRSRGVTGSVTVNGSPRQQSLFRRLSCYVMQEDLLQPNLTLLEAVSVAARLKLGHELSERDRRAAVDEVLTSLGLSECRNTFTHKLSGGQRKRFCIAQELVNNPSVIFLDEPTTGLDHQSSSQCVRLLTMLARQGRTVICSIHQPCASIFHQFDQVYLMTGGHCAYQGATNRLVPFLAAAGFHCPTTHNPADFVIEVLHESSEEAIMNMVAAVQNGKCFIQNSEVETTHPFLSRKLSSIDRSEEWTKRNLDTVSVSFLTQFWILLLRAAKQHSRYKTSLLFMFLSFILGGLLTGFIFYRTGMRGEHPLAHFNFLVVSLVTAAYYQIMAPTLVYPTELELVRREYRNGWYSLNSYALAATIARIPFMHGLSFFFVIFAYVISGQPLEWERFFWYFLVFLLASFVSEGYGLLIGSIFRAQMGAIIAPCIMTPILILWQYNLGAFHTTTLFMKILMSTSFFRLGMMAMILALMQDRAPLSCELLFCPFRYPNIMIKMAGAEEQSLIANVLGLVAIGIVIRICWYVSIRLRLSSNFYNTWINYAYKITRR